MAKRIAKRAKRKKTMTDMIGGNKIIKALVIDTHDDVYKSAIKDLGKINGTKFETRQAFTDDVVIKLCREEEFHVVLVNVADKKPENMSEIIKNIRKITNNAVVITYSYDYNHSMDMAALEAGAMDFLSLDDLTAQKFEKSIRYCLRKNC